MGIKGSVRRGTDGHVIHANIDTDVLVTEEPSLGSTRKPDDLYALIEHFALGKALRRRWGAGRGRGSASASVSCACLPSLLVPCPSCPLAPTTCCQQPAAGRRRLELFGEEHNVRPGWVTVGLKLERSNFNAATYTSHFQQPDGTPYVQSNGRPRPGAPHLLGTTPEIEELRPKSPPPR